MRLIHIFKNEKDARTFAAYLDKEGIENELDVHTDRDWGSADYGTTICKLWEIDEDKVDSAQVYLEEFLQNPNDSRFQIEKHFPKFSYSHDASPSENEQQFDSETRKSTLVYSQTIKSSGVITFYVLMTCVLIFIFMQFSSKE